MTNDEGQMRNRWGKLKVSWRWAIVLVAIAFVSLLLCALFQNPKVVLEVVEIRSEPSYWGDTFLSRYADKKAGATQQVATLEIRNDSSRAILVPGEGSDSFQAFRRFSWSKGEWTSDFGSNSTHLSQDRWLMSNSDWFSRPQAKDVSRYIDSRNGNAVCRLLPGQVIRFRAPLGEKGTPATISVQYFTSPPTNMIYRLLPATATKWIPWAKQEHEVRTRVLLNGAAKGPPWFSTAPRIELLERDQTKK